MNIMRRNIVFVVCVAIFGVATWFAFKPPSSPPLAASILDDPATTTDVVVAPVVVSAPIPASPKTLIEITAPTSNAQWVIGESNSISWDKAAGSSGQIYLVNATSGIIAGWIEQEIGPAQTFFPWDTRDIFLSQTDPLTKDVLPGEYFIKITFLSPQIESAVSAPFWIVTR